MMNRAATLSLASALTLALTAAAPASADILVIGSADISFKELTISPGQGDELNTSLVTFGPSLIWAYKDFYTTLSYDKSIDASNVTQISDAQPSSITMSRSDITVTLGYRVMDFLSVFGGWLKGDTGAHIVGYRSAPAPFSGFVFFTQDISYIEHGPFIGFALSHSFGDKGSLSFSAAYASLTAEFTEMVNYATDPISFRYTQASTDSKGLSYGLIWTGPLTGSLNYRLGAKLTEYFGEDIPGSGGIDEKYTLYFLGLSNYF